jgi:hypothetical protein
MKVMDESVSMEESLKNRHTHTLRDRQPSTAACPACGLNLKYISRYGTTTYAQLSHALSTPVLYFSLVLNVFDINAMTYKERQLARASFTVNQGSQRDVVYPK